MTLEQAEAIRLVLKGEQLAPAGGGLECIRSLPHGHVEAVRIAMRRLGFEKLIDGKASRERDLVVAMVAGRIVAPEASKLAMTHAWRTQRWRRIWALRTPMKTSFTRRWTG